MEWREASGRATTPPSRSGFGSRLIQASVQRQLRGTLAYDWGQDGLTVRFSIPAEHLLRPAPDQGSPAAAPRAPLEIVARPASCRILIVEDEALIGMQLEQALVDHGCEVVGVATNVAEAMQLIERERPHGALLDINLAGEKSFPVAERLAADGVPFVFCTGYAGEQVLPPRFAGAPLVRKPFDAQSVAAIFLDLDGTAMGGLESGDEGAATVALQRNPVLQRVCHGMARCQLTPASHGVVRVADEGDKGDKGDETDEVDEVGHPRFRSSPCHLWRLAGARAR